MFLARVIGQVVATRKDPQMTGGKLLLLRPMLIDEQDPSQFRPGQNTVVAVDALGAGEGDLVLFAQGSSARRTEGLSDMPIDAAVTGIVDSVTVLGGTMFKAN